MNFMRLHIISAALMATLVASTSMAEQIPHQNAASATVAQQQVAELNMSLSDMSAGSSVAQARKEEADEKYGVGMILGMEYSQKTAVDQKGARENDLSILFNPTYTFNSRFGIGAKGIFTQENNGPRNTKFSNTTLTLGIGGVELNEHFQTVHSIAGILPTNEDSQKRDRLKGGVSIANGIAFDSAIVKLKYMIGLSRNFHEYNFNADGDANVEYRLAQTLEATLMITDKFYLSGTGIYRIGRTYGNFQRTNFELHGDINYDVAKTLTLNLGTSNEGNGTKSNGVDSNISAYDDNSSVVRAGITYVY